MKRLGQAIAGLSPAARLPVTAAAGASCSACVAIGAVALSAPAGGSCSTGVNNATLPAGSMAITKNGTTYYLSGNTWFTPAFGANGVHYRALVAP